MKKSLLGLLIVVVVGGLIWYAVAHPLTPGTPSGTASSTSAVGSYTEKTQYYQITANFATSTPLSGAANAAAVAQMQGFVNDTIAQFKKDGNYANLTPNDIKMQGFDSGRQDTLQIVYLYGSSAHTVSYIYTIYEDTGGAHGNTVFKTFVYDTTTGASLTLGDLFTPGSNYLNTLSTTARAELPAALGSQSSSDFINPGTTPDANNFQDFFFDNNNFVLLFPPYQVAPYAAGPVTLYVPASQLKSILKPQYP